MFGDGMLYGLFHNHRTSGEILHPTLTSVMKKRVEMTKDDTLPNLFFAEFALIYQARDLSPSFSLNWVHVIVTVGIFYFFMIASRK